MTKVKILGKTKDSRLNFYLIIYPYSYRRRKGKYQFPKIISTDFTNTNTSCVVISTPISV